MNETKQIDRVALDLQAPIAGADQIECRHGIECPAGEYCFDLTPETESERKTADRVERGMALLASMPRSRDRVIVPLARSEGRRAKRNAQGEIVRSARPFDRSATPLHRVVRQIEAIARTYPGIDSSETIHRGIRQLALWLDSLPIDRVAEWKASEKWQRGMASRFAYQIARKQETGRGHMDRVEAELERSQGNPNYSKWLDESGHELPSTGYVHAWSGRAIGMPESDCESLRRPSLIEAANATRSEGIALALDILSEASRGAIADSTISFVDWIEALQALNPGMKETAARMRILRALRSEARACLEWIQRAPIRSAQRAVSGALRRHEPIARHACSDLCEHRCTITPARSASEGIEISEAEIDRILSEAFEAASIEIDPEIERDLSEWHESKRADQIERDQRMARLDARLDEYAQRV